MKINDGSRKLITSYVKALALAASLAVPANADTINQDNCSDVNALALGASSNFGGALELDITANHTLPLTDAKSCGIAELLAGKREFVCIWEYKHKSPYAGQKYKDLNHRLNHCLASATGTDDQPVNHPDFYALKSYHLHDLLFSVSLKDKSALEKTFVFFRVKRDNVE